jgi:hypothetical protein
VLLALVLLPLAPVLLVIGAIWLLARRRHPRPVIRAA